MRKILLIEDRSHRQNNFLEQVNINLDDYKDILDNKIDDKYDEFIKDMQRDNFDLSKYDVIIAHQTIFINEYKLILGKLKSYCKENHKALVLFSGGNGNSYINNGYEELGLSSEVLYSQNLKLFLDDFKLGNINIRILTYGTRWKLNIMLNILEQMNYFIKTTSKEKVLHNAFEINNRAFFNNIDILNIDLYQYRKEGNKVHLSEIVKLRDDILSHIKEMADE